jgi:hypothetical protein
VSFEGPSSSYQLAFQQWNVSPILFFFKLKAVSLVTLCREDRFWPGGRHRPVKNSRSPILCGLSSEIKAPVGASCT